MARKSAPPPLPSPAVGRTIPDFIDYSAIYARARDLDLAYQSHQLCFFLGSGASTWFASRRDLPAGAPRSEPLLPGWRGLLDRLTGQISNLAIPQRQEVRTLLERGQFLLAAEAIKRFAPTGGEDPDRYIDRRVAEILGPALPPDSVDPFLHLVILDFAAPILTTNYDRVLETVLERQQLRSTFGDPITYRDDRALRTLLSPSRERRPYILKIHGSIGSNDDLILDETDYFRFYVRREWPYALRALEQLLASYMVVFVGFSMADPEIRIILREAVRYAGTYQHLALFRRQDVTETEQDVLRQNFHVQPVLFDDFDDLPYFLVEMRDVCRRDRPSIKLAASQGRLTAVCESVRDENDFPPSTIAIAFGSFAKYGSRSQAHDIDVLFLVPGADLDDLPEELDTASASQQLGLRLDATPLPFEEFERLLRVGDPFASSVLVSGWPLFDPEGRYGILARGFEPAYVRGALEENLDVRYLGRWWALVQSRRVASPSTPRLPEYQWAWTLMQSAILAHGYPADSLVAVSLLGNNRFTIREFCNRHGVADETRLLDLVSKARYSDESTPTHRPDLPTLLETFRAALLTPFGPSAERFRPWLEPGALLLRGDPDEVAFAALLALNDMNRSEIGFGAPSGGYNTGPSKIREVLDELLRIPALNPYDLLFLFDLFHLWARDRDRNALAAGPGEKEVRSLLSHSLPLWRKSPTPDALDPLFTAPPKKPRRRKGG